jgi:hypothetical protein
VSPIETWLWLAFIFACVIAVHPAIDIVADAKWKLDDRIAWERSRRSPVWGRMHSLYLEYVDAFPFRDCYMTEYHAVRRKHWARYLRGECAFIEAVEAVKEWTEKRK